MLSNNLTSSPHTQNWVSVEVGIACALRKRVWVFEELYGRTSFPIPYLTDYVAYDLNNPQLRVLISSVARAYNMGPQRASILGLGALGGLLFGPVGLVGGAVIGALASQRQQPPYANLLCYHPDCKLKFRSYVWLDEMECPACRRTLRFQRESSAQGDIRFYPSPRRWELVYPVYVWVNQQGQLEFVNTDGQ